MAASMRAALVRCGLNQTTANYVMTDQGFDSAEELLMVSKESYQVIPTECCVFDRLD
jgi:hypothetical protein